MLIDCDQCAMRDVACDDCIVSVLLGPPAGATAAASVSTPERGVGPSAIAWARRGIEFDRRERDAIKALVDGGLIASFDVAYITHDDGFRLWSSQTATDRRHAVG